MSANQCSRAMKGTLTKYVSSEALFRQALSRIINGRRDALISEVSTSLTEMTGSRFRTPYATLSNASVRLQSRDHAVVSRTLDPAIGGQDLVYFTLTELGQDQADFDTEQVACILAGPRMERLIVPEGVITNQNPLTAKATLLVLLLDGESYGAALNRTLLERTAGRVRLPSASSVSGLQQLVEEGLVVPTRQERVRSESGEAGTGRPAMFHELTPNGRLQALEIRQILLRLFSISTHRRTSGSVVLRLTPSNPTR